LCQPKIAIEVMRMYEKAGILQSYTPIMMEENTNEIGVAIELGVSVLTKATAYFHYFNILFSF
jgi:hypothetical protein